MGCVSSSLLTPSDDLSQLGGSTLSHHLVKLTSTTYGLLNLDPLSPPAPSAAMISTPATPMTPPERFAISGKESMSVKSEPAEVINFWELMSGLDGSDTCRFSPLPVKCNFSDGVSKENSDPNLLNPKSPSPLGNSQDPKFQEKSENLCGPEYEGDQEDEENRVVIYTTSLRGVRRTFEACSAVRAAIQSFGVVMCERDVSMDRGFREELSSLMAKNRNPQEEEEEAANVTAAIPLPQVFVKGKYIGGAEEVMRLVEEGLLGNLLRGVPRKKAGCDGCGGLSFLPCSGCNGSCKVVEGWGTEAVVVKCTECNENGLVRCPICS